MNKQETGLLHSDVKQTPADLLPNIFELFAGMTATAALSSADSGNAVIKLEIRRQ